MNHTSIDILQDHSNDSLSIIYTDTIGDYIGFVQKAYTSQGGIEGQRRPLKTKTGIRIRGRMIEDITRGAILPPIVIGAIVNDVQFEKIIHAENRDELIAILHELGEDNLSIIDGMQRTTAILEALEQEGSIVDNPIRLELWVSKAINNLIYRMLILNTGQVPWDIKRQLLTIYRPLITEVRNKVQNADFFDLDDQSRRSKGGQYQASKIIEYFLSFTSRKTSIDTKEKVADDFARMNAAEATSKHDLLDDFIAVLQLMVNFDHEFSRSAITPDLEGKVTLGKDIFTSAPAGFGFITAAAIELFGMPGIDFDEERLQKNKEILFANTNELLEKLKGFSDEEIKDFLELLSLNQQLSVQSSKVGEYEREFYKKSFAVLFKMGKDLPSMAPCWEA